MTTPYAHINHMYKIWTESEHCKVVTICGVIHVESVATETSMLHNPVM